MAFYNVIIGSRATYTTEVEASSEEEAKQKAMQEWENCWDASEMEFWNTQIVDVYQN